MTTGWGNFQNWLNEAGERWVFYVMVFMVLSLIPVLIVLLHRHRNRRLDSFPAISTWFGLSLLPALAITAGFLSNSAGSMAVIYILLIPMLICGIPLFAGVVMLRWTQRTGRFPAILIWLGLGLPPVAAAVPFAVFGPDVGATLTVLFAVPLIAGLIGLAIERPLVGGPAGPGNLAPRTG